jgi:hypothetical protein
VTFIRTQDGKPVLRDGKIGTEQACCCKTCLRLIAKPHVFDLNECYTPIYEKMRELLEAAGWTVGEMETISDPEAGEIFVSWPISCPCCIDCGRFTEAMQSNSGSPYHLIHQPPGAWVNVNVPLVGPGYQEDCPNGADTPGCFGFYPDADPPYVSIPTFGNWGSFWVAGCDSIPNVYGNSFFWPGPFVPVSINGDEGGDCGAVWIPACGPDSVWCGDDKCTHPCGDYTDCELVVRVDGPPPDYEPVELLRGPVANYITEGCQIEFSLEDPTVNASLTLQKAWWCRPTIPYHNYPVEILLDCNPLP